MAEALKNGNTTFRHLHLMGGEVIGVDDTVLETIDYYCGLNRFGRGQAMVSHDRKEFVNLLEKVAVAANGNFYRVSRHNIQFGLLLCAPLVWAKC